MDRLAYLLETYFIPGIIIIFGSLCFFVLFKIETPKLSQTTEVSGTLASYYFERNGRGKSNFSTLFKLLEYSNEFEDSFLNKELSARHLRPGETKIKFRIDNNSIQKLNDHSRIQTHGTQLDTKVLQTPEDDIKQDTFLYYVLPFLGLGMFGLAIFIHNIGKRKARKYKKQRKKR